MQVPYAHSHILIKEIRNIKLNISSGRPICLLSLYEITLLEIIKYVINSNCFYQWYSIYYSLWRAML